jgi:thiosulfate/3-mercaptopyruvate sulfurtransferase
MSRLSPEDLLRRLGEPGLRICDVRWWLLDPPRGRNEYEAAHLPGAVFVDVDTDLVATVGPGRHPLPDPATFARRLEAIGIGDDSTVVAYDDHGGAVAARLWWMLDDLGHADVHVLDGGFSAWVAAGGPVTDALPAYAPGRLTLRDRWTKVVDRGALIDRLLADDVTLVDARATERYRGDTEPIDPAPGHIPGAVSRPFTANLGPDSRLLADDELRARFADLPGAVVVSCGSGINACHNALAMRVAGLPDPLLYPGSYSDWSRAGLTVATGDEPGRYEPGRHEPGRPESEP